MIALLQEHEIFNKFKDKYWRYGNTTSGETMCRRFLRIKREYEEFLNNGGLETEAISEDALADMNAEDAEKQQFALESHLRDFLARNLACIEPGLKLYFEGGSPGIEYPVDNGRIDILAVDANESFMVIELKLSRGRNSTIGQLLYYMAWVDKHLGQGPCRGLIVAGEISPELKLAASRVPGVKLAKYNLQFSLDMIFS